VSEEKKEEEKKKEKKTIVLDGYESIQTNLSQAMVAQGTILGSAIARQVMESARIAQAMSNSLGTIKMMEAINSVMRQQNAITQALQNAMQNSAVIGTMAIYENQTRKLAEGIAAISQRIQSITSKVVVPSIKTELATIPHQTNVTVRTLENYIVALEKELAKERAKNKELLALIEEKRKELKKQYVA
jgi:flagellar biosynthesis chaperone FliJ